MSRAIFEKFCLRKRGNSAAALGMALVMFAGCASWPQASPAMLEGKVRPSSIEILPMRVLVRANADESQTIEAVIIRVRDAHEILKRHLRQTLESKGYRLNDPLLIEQAESDKKALSEKPEFASLAQELMTEFATVTNVVLKKRKNMKKISEFKIGKRLEDFAGSLDTKPDAFLFVQVEAYLESSGVRSSRVAKGTMTAIAVGIATLGTVVPVPQTQSLSHVEYFTALVDATTGEFLYMSGLVFPNTDLTVEKAVEKVIKKTYKKLPAPGMAGAQVQAHGL